MRLYGNWEQSACRALVGSSAEYNSSSPPAKASDADEDVAQLEPRIPEGMEWLAEVRDKPKLTLIVAEVWEL